MSSIFQTHCKRSFWFLSLVLNMLYSCKQNRDADIIDNYTPIQIDNKSVSDTLDLSKIIDSVGLVKLIDAPHKSLAKIKQLYALGDYYIAIDPSTKRVNAYRQNGNYEKTLMENGSLETNGLNITDCYVNERNEVIIYDFAQMKLTIYDSSLKIIKAVKGEKLLNYSNIASLPGSDKFVGFSNFNGYNAVVQNDEKNPSNLDILDSTLNLSTKHLFYQPKFGRIKLISLSKAFFPFENSLRFFRAYDPFVYSLSKDRIERRYKVIYSKGNIPSDFLEKIVEPNLNAFNNIGRDPSSFKIVSSAFQGYTCFTNWLETEDIIYLSSASFTDNTFYNFNSIIYKANKKSGVLNAKVFSENSKFKLSFPTFNAYDKEKREFLAYCTGNRLKKYLHPNSPLVKQGDIVEDSFYLIKVRFKRR
jgi:hypothetical protein